ncbi:MULTISPECIES: helix-turn-helix transcriptional regulator [Streptomyces]|uniref:helix-turn-helix transcriptional regulator n=1 Tax=Streptomyces TaxID=1883 RepID=UPI001CC9F323|nr:MULTISPECIES: helix-turn-helix transcriptional regulator [Streptomyces]UBI38749.1 helix-turn-helix transcriptional regulator [Streptomyces mobaraensis]UKW31329.1 helix-turn-helix transcriptional regulator [Streptomyces sp. TYQ1024]
MRDPVQRLHLRCSAVLARAADRAEDGAARAARLSAAAGHARRVGLTRRAAQLEARAAALEVREVALEVGEAAAVAPGPLSALTPQQLRVARHVAEGLTNREVAAVLALSHRTVDHHLRNVFAALGIRSRVQLVHALIPQAPAGRRAALTSPDS